MVYLNRGRLFPLSGGDGNQAEQKVITIPTGEEGDWLNIAPIVFDFETQIFMPRVSLS